MCAQCGAGSTVATCEEADTMGINRTGGPREDCGLRFIYCLQPYGSAFFDPPYIAQLPVNAETGTVSDSVTFEEGFITQTNNNADWNRSNPFTVEFTSWPVSWSIL